MCWAVLFVDCLCCAPLRGIYVGLFCLLFVWCCVLFDFCCLCSVVGFGLICGVILVLCLLSCGWFVALQCWVLCCGLVVAVLRWVLNLLLWVVLIWFCIVFSDVVCRICFGCISLRLWVWLKVCA